MWINNTITSPLEQFEVTNLITFNAPLLNNLNITVTNLSLYSVIVIFLTIFLHIVFKGTGNNNNLLVPSKWSVTLESIYATINGIVRDQIGTKNEIYLPFIYSLFFFILIANLVSNVPYNYAITTSIIVTLSLSFTIVMGVLLLGLYLHKFAFFSLFVPTGTPLALVPLLVLIELLSFLARALSLGVRLFANLTAGHTLLKILSTFLYQLFNVSILVAILTLVPFAIFLALIGLEFAVSLIQSYVFVILTCSYLKDAIELH